MRKDKSKTAEYHKEYRIRNSEKIKSSSKLYRINHIEEKKKYDEINKDRIRETANTTDRKNTVKLWNKNNPEKLRAKYKKYDDAHKERKSLYRKIHYKNNIDAWKERSRKRILNITDDYIAYSMGIHVADLRQYPELIEVKRLIIKTNRLCKTLKN